MEKIKNFLKPGGSKDDEILYGTGQSTGTHTDSLTGEGSHLEGSKNTSNSTGVSATHNLDGGNTSNSGVTGPNVPRDSTSRGGQSVAHSQGLAGQGSHLASATSGQTPGLGSNTSGVTTTTTTQTHIGTSHDDRDAALGAGAGGVGLAEHERQRDHGLASSGTTSGGENTQNTSLSSKASGPHSSNLANRADPTVDSDNSRFPAQSQPSTTKKSGLGDAQIGGGSIGRSALSGLTGDSTGSRNAQITSGGSGPTGHNTDPTNTQTAGQITPGQHIPGEWIDEADTSRHVGTGVTGNNTTSSGHLGRDAALIGTTGAVASKIHSHRENERGLGSTTGSSGLAQDSHLGSNTGVAPGTDTSIGSHLGRDTAAVGSAGALDSGIQSHRENDKNLGSTTGSPSLTQDSHLGSNTGATQGTNTSSGSHLGRDAAVIGSAGAVRTGVHNDRENERGLGTNSGYTGTNESSTHHTGSHGPHSTDTANLLDPSHNTRTSGHEAAHEHSPIHGGGAEEADHHHGRNAAIGVGGAGALGLAAHEHGQHRTQQGTGIGTTSGVGHSTASSSLDSSRGTDVETTSGVSQSTGPAPHTAGPHPKDYQNVLDPRVTPQNAATQGSAQTAHSTTDSSDQHYGRDAALGTGAVGAAGLAGTQYQQHQTGSNVGTGNTSNVSRSTPGTDNNSGASQTTSAGGYGAHPTSADSKEHRYGRDAAVAGGVGTAAYAAGKHHNDSQLADRTRADQHGTSTTASDPYATGSSTAQRSTVDPTTDRSNDHHYGRDAAAAGGAAGVAGGATYEADKHRDKDLAKAQRDAEKKHDHDLKQAKKDHKHDLKQAEKEHKKDMKEAEKHHEKKEKKGGLLSFLHRDKTKKYSAEEEAEFDRQEREHNDSQSHTGRNAALGGAAVGAAGAGAYEANKHHDADTSKSLPTTPENHGIGTAAGTQNSLAGNTSSTSCDPTTKTPLDHKPVGKDIGDHLHGDRNRGVQGASGFAGSSGFADGTTGRDHGGPLHDHSTVGHHSVSEATTDQHGRPVESGSTAAEYETSGSQHNTVREFPLGGAGTTQHHGVVEDKTSPSNTSSGLTGSQHQSEHHTGGDAAAIGGAGLVREHEYRKHDTTSGHQQSGLTGSSTQHQSSLPGANTQAQSSLTGTVPQSSTSGGYRSVLDPGPQSIYSPGSAQDHHQRDTTSGSQTSHDTTSASLGSSGQQNIPHHENNTSSHSSGTKTSDLSGRNRLHKEPPASHPAAQSQAYSGGNSGNVGYAGESDGKGTHVPASGVERERVVEQGGEGLARDTEVANAPGANAGANY